MVTMQRGKGVITALSVLHFTVDLLCAYAVYTRFLPAAAAARVFFTYNLCAFALQLPLGAAIDLIDQYCVKAARRELAGFLFAAGGAVLTLLGCFTSLFLLGLGNALFHVGGGVLTIGEDDWEGLKGRGLGIFVAPGAVGLFLGTAAGKGAMPGLALARGAVLGLFGTVAAVALLLLAVILRRTKPAPVAAEPAVEPALPGARTIVIAVLCCFLVVVLRSCVGLAVSFPWKNGFAIGLLAVICVAGGKAAGGFLAAAAGMRRAAVGTLLLAAACYLGGSDLLPGLLALFLFNMTMPMTLYKLKQILPGMPGLAFGILTFALFIGFLPVLGGYLSAVDGRLLGAAGSILSLLFLLPVLTGERPVRK